MGVDQGETFLQAGVRELHEANFLGMNLWSLDMQASTP